VPPTWPVAPVMSIFEVFLLVIIFRGGLTSGYYSFSGPTTGGIAATAMQRILALRCIDFGRVHNFNLRVQIWKHGTLRWLSCRSWFCSTCSDIAQKCLPNKTGGIHSRRISGERWAEKYGITRTFRRADSQLPYRQNRRSTLLAILGGRKAGFPAEKAREMAGVGVADIPGHLDDACQSFCAGEGVVQQIPVELAETGLQFLFPILFYAN